MTKIMYEIPSRDDVEEVIITKECVTEKAAPKLVLKAMALPESSVEETLKEAQ